MNRGTVFIALQLVGVGWYVAICIVGGLLGGLWIDQKLDTVPAFTLAGVVLGTVLAFYGIYKMVLPLMNLDKETKKDNNQGQ
ncbi:MAG: AtpZ/AtpI family protein [Chloroflexi bacterium]|nr:AtpZ/AtpI family protein [Chloroflexota bacterium]